MKRVFVLLSALMGAVPLAHALTEVVDGIEWNYELRNGDYDENGNYYEVGYQFAAIYNPDYGNSAIPTSTSGEIVIPSSLGGYQVRHIGNWAFQNCANISAITVPASISYVGLNAFLGTTRLRDVTFLGDTPVDFSVSDFPEGAKVFFHRQYGAKWERLLTGTSLRGGWIESLSAPTVQAVFPITGGQAGDQQSIQATYTVASAHGNATVEVRPVAFLPGERTIKNVIFPAQNLLSGCGVVPVGEEQTFSWGWGSQLEDMVTRLHIELLVKDGALLPKETVTIPSPDNSGIEYTITRNGISERQAFQALLWYLSERDSRLTIDGDAILLDGKKVFESGNFGFDDTLLLNYLYGKEGYAVPDENTLQTVESILGTSFPRSGLGQIAIKR